MDILYSFTKNSYYIGITGDNLNERLLRHNSNHKGFTGDIGDWVVKYLEIHSMKELAYQRERQVKGWKRRKMMIN